MAELELTDNCALHYLSEGGGERSFLLFNGATLPLEFWGTLADHLARAGRVVRFDQRNAGSTRAQGLFSLNDIARDADRLLDHLGVERAVVVGHAWGGRAAQVFVRDYPHRVEGMVICGTGGQFPPSGDAVALKSLNEAMRSGDRAAWGTLVEAIYCAPGFSARHPQTFADVCDAIWSHPPPRGIRWDPRVSPSTSYWGLARIPTLLIYGRHDRFGTPENAADLHQRIPGSRLVTLEDAGHFVIREAEERVADEIGHFIGELPPGKGDRG